MNSFFSRQVILSKNLRILLLYLLSLLIPIFVMVLGLIALHVTPFGNHNLAISDARWYVNGELFFSRLLQGQENQLYSLNNGIGGNEWANLAWGGITIGGLLSLLGTLETMPTIFTWICVLNIAICGPTMYALLAHERGYKVSNIIFSTSYALIGFNVVYCHEPLFFWGPQLLPLTIIGLLNIIRNKSPLLYIITLASCSFFDFYFAFHLGVAAAIVAAVYAYANRGTDRAVSKKAIILWVLSSLIAVMIAAPMWLPALKAYSGGGRLNQTTIDEFSFSQNMPFIQIFSKLFTGAYSLNEMATGLPNIFCGIFIVALAVLYFVQKSNDKQRKIATGSLLIVYLLSFYITALTLVMHGGTHTNWFPYRYSYVFSFFLICLAFEEFSNLHRINSEDVKKCAAILSISTILVFSTNYEFISGGAVLLDFALLLIICVAFKLYRRNPYNTSRRTLMVFLLLVVCANLYANFIITISSMREWELNLDEYERNTFISGALVDTVKLYDTSLYRMEKDKSESNTIGADSYKYDYNGISHSGPTERMFIHKGLNKLGINWYDMRHWYSEGIPAATDTLLGLKYIISTRDLSSEKNYERLVGIDNTAVYKNENALNIALLSDVSAANIELDNDAFKNLNSIWCSLANGNTEIFTEESNIVFSLHNSISDIDITSDELRESISQSAIEDQTMENGDEIEISCYEPKKKHNGPYIEYSFIAAKSGPIYLFDTSVPDSNTGIAFESTKYCGFFEEGQEVRGTLDINGTDYINQEFFKGYCSNLVFAYADNDVLKKYAQEIHTRNVSIYADKENNITGEFAAMENQRIVFTLPWDEGWQLFIDGQIVPIEKTWDLFMSAKVPSGKHTYEMRFIPAWMDLGIGLSIGSIITLIIIICFRRAKLLSSENERNNTIEDMK